MQEGFAHELGRIPMSPAMAATLSRALDYTRAQSHRQISLEHLLLALTEDEEAAQVLQGCNVDLVRLRDDLASFLGQLNDRVAGDNPAGPAISPELKRIVEYAAAAAQQARRNSVNGAIALAAMIGEGRSMAATFLRAQGLTFEVAVRVLQQQPRQQPSASQPSAHSAEDILATARERVAASRGQGPGPTPHTPLDERLSKPRAEPAQPVPDLGIFHTQQGEKAPEPAARQSNQQRQATPSLPHELPPDGGMATAWDAPLGSPVDEPEPQTGRAPPPLPRRDDSAGLQARTAQGAPGLQVADDDSERTRPPLPHWMTSAAPQGQRPAAKAALQETPQPRPNPDDDFPAVLRQPQPAIKEGPPITSAPARKEGQQRTPAPQQQRRDAPAPGPAVESGQLVENIPRRMRVGVAEAIEIRVAKDSAEGAMHGVPPGRGAPVRTNLYITKIMSARLLAPQGGFGIESTSPEAQWIEATRDPLSDDFAAWRFLITPQQVGKSTLQVVVTARVVGRDGVVADTTLPERVIQVQVAANHLLTAWRWSGWIAAFIVGAIAGKLGGEGLAALLSLLGRSS
jgi:hypothetical protein